MNPLELPVHLLFSAKNKKTGEMYHYGKDLTVLMDLEGFKDKIVKVVSRSFEFPIEEKGGKIEKNKIILNYFNIKDGITSEIFELKGMSEDDYKNLETHEIDFDNDSVGIVLTKKRKEIYDSVKKLLTELKLEIPEYQGALGGRLIEDEYLKFLLDQFPRNYK